MPVELPSDVKSVLQQLFAEGETALLAGEMETARAVVTTAETVCRNKLPEGDLRTQLVHGCRRVESRLDPADGVHAVTAAEYLRAMARRLANTGE